MITAKNLTHTYPGDEETAPKTVLTDICMDVKDGEFVAIVGHNGSGKSTLAKHFNAILLPSGGKVYVNGLDTEDEKLLFEIRKQVGMVFQNPDNQIVAAVVEDDVAFAPENLGVLPAKIRARVDAALKDVGMYEKRLSAPHHLSGGQKQRIAIAGILAMQPKHIILDEPTAMLDPVGRREVLNTVKKLNREQGMSVALITHYMDEAAQADRIIVMRGGKIFMEGAPRDIFSKADLLRTTGLDIPQATELAHLLKAADIPIRDDIIFAEEFVEEILKLL